MARVKNLNEFHKAVVNAKRAAHQMRLELERYQAWYEAKDVYYQTGKKGREWAKHLFEVHQLVEAVEALEMVGQRFDIRRGELVLLNEPKGRKEEDEE